MADPVPTLPVPPRASFRVRRSRNVRRPGPVTALDLDGSTLRVVQTVPRNGQAEVTRIAALDLDPELDRTDAAVLGRAIGKALADARLKAGMVVMGVPRHLVVLRTLSLPAVEDEREMASIVHMQIGKDLPFRAEEAVIDFCVRDAIPGKRAEEGSSALAGSNGEPGAERKDVLIAAVRKAAVDFYLALAEAAGFKLAGLGLTSQANARCLAACGIAPPNEAVALVCVHPEEVSIDVASNQALLFSRGSALPRLMVTSEQAEAAGAEGAQENPVPTSTTAAAPPWIDAVTVEVVRTLHAYGMESSLPVTKLVLAGEESRTEPVLEALMNRVNLSCALLQPARALGLNEADRPLASSSTAAIGLGLGANDSEGLLFDFLTPKRPAVQRNMKRIRTLALTTVGALALIGLLALRSHWINQRLKIQRQVQSDIAAAEKNRSKFRQLQQQASTIQNWVKEGRSWLDQYAYLSAVLPSSEDLYLTSLSVSGQGVIHMAVQARSGEILAQLDRQLRAAGYEVKPLAINPGSDKFGYNFRSSVELVVPAKMKIELAKLQVPPRPADDGSLDPKTRPARRGGRQ